MWLKGNLHTHTNESDGDAPIATVVNWYAGHGYDFLALTDHNLVTLAQHESLILFPSTEITLSAGGKPVHVNAYNVGQMQLEITGEETVVQAMQRAVDAAREAGGIPQINHPNFRWAFDDETMARVSGWSLLELYNPSTDTNNFGYGGRVGHEAMWDRLLSTGRRVFAVACDDSHEFIAERWGHVSPPGLAWVQVWTEERTAAAILAALEAGDFYASTEVEFDELLIGETELRLHIHQVQDYAYTTLFIGREGRVLSAVHGIEPSYALRGGEGYVRAKVLSSNGGWAWTQPLWE